ncbi:MAG: ATP-dependent Clp protease proteolytic subunit [Lachnospiraceae bacterium]|nr:ATP-dependent Clp protease proteolytic subunit [Lachnospiraceae bacterium]
MKKLQDELMAITVPMGLENMELPDPSLLTFYRNIEERTLWIDSDVDESTVEYGRLILQWNRDDKGLPVEERKPIKIMFFSNGGDLDVNNSLIDVIKMSKTPVYGYNMGKACSAACFIYMACHKRYVMPNATFLLHKGSAAFDGNFEEVAAHMQEYQRQIDGLCAYIMANSKIDKSTLDENIWGEWYMTAEEAVKYGVADRIVTDLDEVI